MSSTQQTAARSSSGCALAKTGGDASTSFTTASVLLGAGALLTAGSAFRRRKRKP
ncbi:LPXTG cell wall anchor domain-containing protein [Tenggerimyces flavus]|uniref:LPXTG cell wall anchor domain-containing protein n=1 Tax=Tenggerimyces flavus TaxID=1708749 RepID=A0ABV7YL94_9ACTN|nr:LPXTG cell wall anchor domain-containing protein [Tenggerimyces flavus]MBM7789599.1 LPXTG-motif cell wall-anchored protein [Tenggerimyces flavus]